MDSKYSLERLYEIWDDTTGECIQIGPDRDGLGLIELRLKDDTGKVATSVTMTVELAGLVRDALVMLLGGK